MRPSVTYLDITSPTIQIQVQILDLPKVREQIVEILLAGFFMDIGDDDDPAFNGADGSCAGLGGHRGVFGVVLGGGCGRIDVYFHFYVGHYGGWIGGFSY